jgi:hypothetical protein
MMSLSKTVSKNCWPELPRDVIKLIFDRILDDEFVSLLFISKEMLLIVTEYRRNEGGSRKFSRINYCNYGATHNMREFLDLGFSLKHPHNFVPLLGAALGYRDVLEWSDSNEIPLHKIDGGYQECVLACTFGHVSILDWLYEKEKTDKCSFFYEAVKYNHICVLEWAVTKGYLLDSLVIKEIIIYERKEMFLFVLKNDPTMDLSICANMASTENREGFSKWIKDIINQQKGPLTDVKQFLIQNALCFKDFLNEIFNAHN